MPGFYLWKDKASRFLKASKETAQLFGFQKPDDLLGLSDFDIRGDAVNSAERWIKQDQLVLKTQKPITKIEISGYSDGVAVPLLLKKAPFYDDSQNLLGVFCECIELPLSIAHQLHQSQCHGLPLDACTEIEYRFEDFGLSRKESECLYFTIRGHTAKSIADRHNRSVKTIEKHLSAIKSKMACRSKQDLIEKCIDLGLQNSVLS